jgi:hypothetical protein
VQSVSCEDEEEEKQEKEQMESTALYEDRNTMSVTNITRAKIDAVYVDIETGTYVQAFDQTFYTTR